MTWRNVTRFAKLAFLLFILVNTGMVRAQDNEALQTVKRVANRIISDTHFSFQLVPQENELGVQVIDARFVVHPGYVYALAKATAHADSLVRFGINADLPVKIWINRQPVFEQTGGASLAPVEIAYDRFRFQQQFSAKLKKGSNEILVRIGKGNGHRVAFLRAINEMGYLDTAVNFAAQAWTFAGPFPSLQTITPEQQLLTFYNVNGETIIWQAAPQRLLPELVVDPKAAYQRDPYADWQYSHGTMVWTILQLGDYTKDPAYTNFVKDYTGFAVQHLDYFRYQYDSLFAFRGSYHRIFRRTMLDDAGAPALPFFGLYLESKDESLRPIINPIIPYITSQQPRLADGTFCRPEPVEFTVWCDDLFMSTPLLLQMARITGDPKYYDDAARQAINFQKYLKDPQTGLYHHGWFSTTQSPSPVYWGRADGWIAWGLSELLAVLPAKHPLYKTILKNFQQYMNTLARYQAPSGMWHQVLDNEASYEETSCTAMFVLAMARGVRMGWLDAKYKTNARKGWQAVASHITADGVVQGICRGTDMGYDQSFYMNRKTIDNDPRGLGAVIIAGLEVAQLK